jgi:predicted O-methyltransferase YrrM
MIRTLLRRFLRKLGSSLTAGIARKQDIDNLYDLVAGLMQVQSAMAGAPVLKPLRIWVISPDAMAWLLADLQERQAPTILEFGCGQSTVIFAAFLKNKGAGRLISIEHDPEHAAAVRRQLDACGLAGLVDLRVVPLVEYPAKGALAACRSYRMDDLPDLTIDVALIDGPPYTYGDAVRYHPVEWVLPRLAPGGCAYLDDTQRAQERAVLQAIAATYPDVRLEDLRAEKGLTRMARQQNR